MFNLAGSYMVEMALLGVIVSTLKFKLIPFLEREREREREREGFLPNDLPSKLFANPSNVRKILIICFC